MQNKKMESIKLFSHNDLDGKSPYILLKYFYPNAQIDYSFCNYGEINEKVEDFIFTDEFLNFDAVYFTDISVSEEIAEKLQNLADTTDIEIRLFDHHKTAEGLNQFPFCKVMIEDDGELTCGTRLFHKFLVEERGFESPHVVDVFVKYVNDYDTWLWKDKYQYELPNEWNDLFQVYGKDFPKKVLEKFKKGSMKFDATDKIILRFMKNEKKAYVFGRTRETFVREIGAEQCAIVFAERFTDDVTSKLAEIHPECPVQIVIGQNGMSFRCKGENTVDLTKIASLFGGGGHVKASGAGIDKDLKETYLDMILEKAKM